MSAIQDALRRAQAQREAKKGNALPGMVSEKPFGSRRRRRLAAAAAAAAVLVAGAWLGAKALVGEDVPSRAAVAAVAGTTQPPKEASAASAVPPPPAVPKQPPQTTASPAAPAAGQPLSALKKQARAQAPAPAGQARPGGWPQARPYPFSPAERKGMVTDLYQKGRQAQLSGDLSRAAQLYTQALNVSGGQHAPSANNLGVIQLSQGQYDVAGQSFSRAMAVSPAYADPVYNMACLYAKKGDNTLALQYLEKAVGLNPEAADWAREDPDLEAVSSSPAFQRLVGKQEQ
ncbi:MAG: tetratricopeptide repeat protein [Deltaproteobacteria bacterium]|nr:tetratricopeptide repeat protein [Deltaproteobacteria bacterium]